MAIVLALALSASSVAAKLYVYTGLQYAGASGVYTSSMRITGTFTTADPLPSNMPLTPIGPGGLNLVTGWSFTDGVNTLTNNNSTLLYGGDGYFLVSTDENGQIALFGLGFMSPLPPNTVGQPMDFIFFTSEAQQVGASAPCTALLGALCESIPASSANSAYNFAGGTWSALAEPVPVLTPPVLVVLAGLILLTGCRLRDRPRKSA